MPEALIGVSTYDLPTIKAAGITGSALNRAGIVARFERGPVKTLQVTSYPEAELRFGKKQSSFYGMFCLEQVFQNLDGVAAVLDIRREIASDAVAASASVNNTAGSPAAVWTVKAGQLGEEDPGTWANGTLGFLILASNRVVTKITATATATTTIEVEAAAEYAVGDIIQIGSTKVVVTAVDELNSTLTVSGAVTAAIDDAVSVLDRTIKVYRKDATTGLIQLVETISNVTTSSASAYYSGRKVNSDTNGSYYLLITHLTTASAGLPADLPAVDTDDIANITWLSSGTNGTAVSEADAVALIKEFDDGIWTTNFDRSTESFNQALETECYNSGEGKKIAILTPAYADASDYALAKSLIMRQRISRKYHGLWNGAWVSVDDPTGVGVNAKKTIPAAGAILGFAINEQVRRGVHRPIATKKKSLIGIRGIANKLSDIKPSTKTERQALTELANLGMNWLTPSDTGFFIRSAHTASKAKEYTFSNAIFMQCYFKATFQNDEVIAELENETDTDAILKGLRNNIIAFMTVLHQSSTNNGVESAFARFVKPNGQVTNFNDVVRVVADASINSFDDVTSGIVKCNVYFMPPTPAEKILIGVGLLFQL